MSIEQHIGNSSDRVSFCTIKMLFNEYLAVKIYYNIVAVNCGIY